MKMNINIIPVLCFLLLCSCKNGNASIQSTNETVQDTIKSITLPAIPTMMTAPEQRANFLVKHYWDNVNFADTNYIHHPEVTEQLLRHTEPRPFGNRTRSHAENNRTNERRQKSIHLHHRPG